jgi:hypothetical protein
LYAEWSLTQAQQRGRDVPVRLVQSRNTEVRFTVRLVYDFHSADAALALVLLGAGPIDLQLPHERTHVPAPQNT